MIAGAAAPAAAAAVHHLHLSADRRAASLARRFVSGELADLSDEAQHAAALMTSELVTNAVLHAGGALILGVALTDEGAVVAVRDGNLRMPEQQPYSDERTDGRGMALVAAMSRNWGTSADDLGKVVWFTVGTTGAALPGAAPAGAACREGGGDD